MEEAGQRQREDAPDIPIVPLLRRRNEQVPENVAADPPPAVAEEVGQGAAAPPQPIGPGDRPTAPTGPELQSTPNTAITPIAMPRENATPVETSANSAVTSPGLARRLEDTSQNLVRVLPSSPAAAPPLLEDTPLGGMEKTRAE